MPPDHSVWGFFVVGGTGLEQHGRAAGGAIKALAGLLLSPRFPTRRNVYQERCRQTIRSGDFFVAEVTGRGPERAKAGYHHYDGILPFVR